MNKTIQKVILIGGTNIKNLPRGGQEAKNQKLVKHLKTLNISLCLIDTYNWKTRLPIIVINLIKNVLFASKQKILISAADESAYRLISLMSFFGMLKKNRVYYFVIGGDFSQQLRRNPSRLKRYNCLTGIYPESQKMVKECKELGLNNVHHVPNFREVPTPIIKKTLTQDGVIHFIYLARITPDKGSEIVLKACEELNNRGLFSKYKVDFYGFFHPDTDNYESKFTSSLQQIPNASYKGFLDVNSSAGFQILYNYDMLLFPTYWATEGYSGTLIDALSAGLPAITTDWNYNGEIVKDGYNGKLIPPKNAKALADEMQALLCQPEQILEFSAKAYESAKAFDISFLINKTIFAKN